MSKIMSFIGGAVVATMLTVVVTTVAVNQWLKSPVNIDEDTVITIKKGDTLSQLARNLAAENIIPSADALIIYARLTQQTTIKVGEYVLPVGSNHQALLTLLQSEDVIRYSVTLVEGKTFDDFVRALQRNPTLIHTIDLKKDYAEILKVLNLALDHPEGWFFPDTYQFVRGMSDADILRQAHQRMKKVLDEQWQKRSKNLPYKNAYEALIMASIIEKETGVPYERSEIAGVFVRRLNKGMRLQTDPTIIYGLGREYKGNIRRKHLRQKTPYNTYVIDGLPPTPIAMPGREAIYAALHPKPGKSLFFVAKGDGSHQFSETLVQHNRAVRKYQIEQRREQYRSSPSQ